MAYKILKRGKEINYQEEKLKEALENLGVFHLYPLYPNERKEAWRRFPPSLLIDPLWKNSTSVSLLSYEGVPSIEESDAPNLVKEKAWEKWINWEWEEEKQFFFQLGEKFFQRSSLSFLYIPPKEKRESFIKYELKEDLSSKEGLFLENLFIWVGKDAEVEIFLKRGVRNFYIGRVYIYLEEGASSYIHLLDKGGRDSATFLSYLQVDLEERARLTQGYFNLGAKLSRHFHKAKIRKQGGFFLYGLHIGERTRSYVDFLMEQLGSYSESDMSYKMVLLDQAYAVFRGMIYIAPNTVSCNGYQQNRNLILGEGSRVDSIPMLEILAEDVRCTHGSATSEIGELELFYLMSRALSKEEAKKLLIGSFLEEVLHKAFRSKEERDLYKEVYQEAGELIGKGFFEEE